MPAQTFEAGRLTAEERAVITGLRISKGGAPAAAERARLAAIAQARRR